MKNVKLKKQILSGALAAAMLAALTACAGKEQDGSGTDTAGTENSVAEDYKGITLRFVADNHSWTTSMEEVIAEFEEETGAKVEIESYSEDNLLSKLNVEFAGNSESMDVVMFRPPLDAGTFIGNGWLEPLDRFIEEDTEFEYAEEIGRAHV